MKDRMGISDFQFFVETSDMPRVSPIPGIKISRISLAMAGKFIFTSPLLISFRSNTNWNDRYNNMMPTRNGREIPNAFLNLL
jgi:hypothetical protein